MLTLLDLADEQYVSLTTFRRSGEAVSTTVWIARDGDALIVTTAEGSGKVKRLRNDPRVQLRPSGRTGKVAEGAPSVDATAEITEDAASVERFGAAFAKKYGFQYRLLQWLGSRGKAAQQPRVTLRIS